jgi:adenine phosphoribosyltransferase
MLTSLLKEVIKTYPDFPKKGINFIDLMPILNDIHLYKELITKMSEYSHIVDAKALIAIDARGFLFASSLGFVLSKPVITARKPGKLPGDLIEKTYDLEYGSNSLSMQKDLLDEYQEFAIIDDLLATGGTLNCVISILNSMGKVVTGASVVAEIKDLKGRDKIPCLTTSEVIF